MTSEKIRFVREVQISYDSQERNGRIILELSRATGNSPAICSIIFEGIDAPLHEVYGGDDLQALSFAIHATYEEIVGLESATSSKIWWNEDGDIAGLRKLFSSD